MAQHEVSDFVARLTAPGIRGKALGLAGLGLCALPCVLIILIWRDVVLVAGLAPLLAIGSASLAALATLVGLDLILRPVSHTRLALGRLLGGSSPADLPRPQAGPAGRLMSDAQRVIDELIALRAEPVDDGGLLVPDDRPVILTAGMPGDAPDQVFDHVLAAADTVAFGAPELINDAAVPDRADDLLALEQQLRRAIKREEFELYYQPVIDLDANRPLGAEALIRWHSPERGFVAPGMFIPLAEASGLIDPISQWVLREACREAAGWDPDLRVAINLGARQFLDQNLTWHISEAIDAAGIRPDQLGIELTESVAMIDYHHTRATFTALRDMGLHIAIDNFGSGHASMSTLGKLPFTTLKIDREYVADVHREPGSLAICDALITLGAGLGLEVVAEGTEKAEEVAVLRGRGCSLFQGYYFARPVPAPVLAATFDNLWQRKAVKISGAA